MTDEQPGSDRRRIEALETVVRSLVAEVAALRAERSTERAPAPSPEPAAAAPPPPPPPPLAEPVPVAPKPAAGEPRVDWGNPDLIGAARARAAQKRATSPDLEQLVGRYGTVVVATFSILVGLGVFLQWAVTRGLLGPEVRVALGAVAALVLAAGGLWMRRNRSARFGDALLVIALAVVHLDAWAAGPGLGLVPSSVALGVAAIASLALASLALREGQEFLFCLGLAGALAAPFVTSAGEGNVAQLLLFGGAVLSAAIVALRDPDWSVARRLVPLFAGWYMVAGEVGRTSAMLPSSRFWPATLALVLALVALTVGARQVRRGLANGLLPLLALAIFTSDVGRRTPEWTAVAYALFGLLTAHAFRRRTATDPDEHPDTWYEVAGLPLFFLLSAVFIRDRIESPSGAGVAAAWIALTSVFLVLDGEKQRGRHLTVMLIASLVATAALLHDQDLARMIGFAAVGIVSVYALGRVGGPALLLPVFLALGFGTIGAIDEYDGRFDWSYTPFVNDVALATAAVVVAFAVLSWTAARTRASSEGQGGRWSRDESGMLLILLGPVAAFLWVRQELVGAFSSDVATFLVISYYALTGVGTILLGRARGVSGLRQAGLVLSLFAAVKVVMEASGVESIGLRVGSYLVVGAFLLGVGYLYRGGAPTAASDA